MNKTVIYKHKVLLNHGIILMKENEVKLIKDKTSEIPCNAGESFSEQAIDFIIINAGIIPASIIANRLGRTVKSVRRKAEKLQLSLAIN